MNKNIELEYKVLVSKEQFYDLYNHYNKPTFFTQVNVYYDTFHLDIRKMRGAMRIRDVDGDHIFTLKLPSVIGVMEFEKSLPENKLESLQDEEILTLLQKNHIQGPFRELTTLKTQRAIINTGYAELCFDISSYGDTTDYEIEYEYIKDHDGLKAFQEIMDTIHVTYTGNCISKIQRALLAANIKD